MITRKAKIIAIWTCEDKKNSRWKMHYVNVNITQTYETKRPKEDLNRWLDERAYAVVKKMCERSCESLCDSCFCDYSSIDYSIIEGPTEEGKVIPSDILANIQVILRKIKENIDDVDYVQELNNELDRILSRNDLTRDDIKDML